MELNRKEIEKLISEKIEELREELDRREPSGLYKPISYTLESGGKRLRPMMLLSAAAACGGDPERYVNQALAFEVFHNFTLLHDDVMDKSQMRRGRETVYVKWDINTAILSGDAMLTLSEQLLEKDLPEEHASRIEDIFHKMGMEIYDGQQYDIDFEKVRNLSMEEYMKMIRLKTSVLFGAACRTGATLAGGNEETCAAFEEYGEKLGLAFQLRDDWLDVYGDSEEFGKRTGLDILDRKKTWLLVSAMKANQDELYGILDEDLEDEEMISQVTRLYNRLGLSEACNKEIERLAGEAVSALKRAEISEGARDYFISFAEKCRSRKK